MATKENCNTDFLISLLWPVMQYGIINLVNFNSGNNMLPQSLLYKSHQISKLKCFSSRPPVVFTQSNEARCWVKNEDVVGAAPIGDAPTNIWVINNFIAY